MTMRCFQETDAFQKMRALGRLSKDTASKRIVHIIIGTIIIKLKKILWRSSCIHSAVPPADICMISKTTEGEAPALPTSLRV